MLKKLNDMVGHITPENTVNQHAFVIDGSDRALFVCTCT